MIVHLDMDAFFASVEQLDDPSLRGRPVIVGGSSERGVVSTASYEARRFGVHSAMPVVMARKLCPQGVFLPGRRERYAELSRRVMEVLSTFSPLVEQASIDEAYLDITGTERLFGDVNRLVARLKADVRRATGGLTCSVGVAPIKFLAKICSDINKPDGVFILRPESLDAFLCALPVRKLPGVGKRMAEKLGEQMKPQALKRIRTRLTLEAVVKAENITASDEAVEAQFDKMAEAYKMDKEQIKGMFAGEQLDQLKEDVAVQEAIDFLVAEAKLVD